MSNAKPAQSNPATATVHEPVPSYQVLLLRGSIIGCGVLGAYLFIRNSKLFASLKHVNEIPESFIKKQLQLKGIVRNVEPNGVLKIEHTPVIGLPKFLRPRRNPSELLRVRLAGIDVSKSGVDYALKDLKLKDRKVFFSVIKPTTGDSDTADVDLTMKRSVFGTLNLNTDIIRKGYGRVYTLDTPAHYDALQNNSAYSRLVSHLLMCEKVAEKRGFGVWSRSTWVEELQSLPSTAGQIIRHSSISRFFVLLGQIAYDLCVVFVSVVRHAYYFVVASAGYAAVGYRAFGNRVNQFSQLYGRLRSRLGGRATPQVEKK